MQVVSSGAREGPSSLIICRITATLLTPFLEFIFPRIAMSSNQDNENPPSESAVLGEELLPPVEPPSARFILQLFVIPAIIVLCVVLLWLLVTTMASKGADDPAKIVSALRGSNQARWQKALNLANMLNNPRYQQLKSNRELAGELAQLLEEEVEAEATDENSIQLRYYLCRVLGEFQVDEGLGVLLNTARTDVERDVRREAINALAVLSDTFQNKAEPETLYHEKLTEVFQQLASDKDDLIRSQTAFALGVFVRQPDSPPEWTQELEVLADDLYSDARYNAALALAQIGNAKAAEALAEMLSPEALKLSLDTENLEFNAELTPALQTQKRDTILKNALIGMDTLLNKNSDFDSASLIAAIQNFIENAEQWELAGPLPEGIIDLAKDIQQRHSS